MANEERRHSRIIEDLGLGFLGTRGILLEKGKYMFDWALRLGVRRLLGSEGTKHQLCGQGWPHHMDKKEVT